MNTLLRCTPSISLALAFGLCQPVSALGDDAVQLAQSVALDTQLDTATGVRNEAAEPTTAPAELLRLAFDASSKFPLDPHAKNRSRQQLRSLEALLQLDEADVALELAAEIADWRRGSALAAIALHLAERNAQQGAEPADRAEIEALLNDAAAVAEELARDADSQAWRRDEIRARIARTYRALGELKRAAFFEADLAASEATDVAAARARQAPAADFDAQLARLDAIAATEGLDERLVAISGFAALYDRFYADAERRELLEARVREECDTLPLQVRIDNFTLLTEFALQHGDHVTGLRLAKELRRVAADNRWLPQDQIPLTGRIAMLLLRAGDAETARHEVDIALAMYRSSEERIVDIFRSETLLPLAEARHALGDGKAARALYLEALQAGALNPNARPRCEDLVGACVSLALNGVPLDAALYERLRAIDAGLVAPW
ncbi:MAG: hypothetical protein DHS20C15_30560 [Planctomycetota bacterium]|nr:MAG: hypothetical protein DHS20C15_30560 [Planctomycetota bacterium]